MNENAISTRNLIIWLFIEGDLLITTHITCINGKYKMLAVLATFTFTYLSRKNGGEEVVL